MTRTSLHHTTLTLAAVFGIGLIAVSNARAGEQMWSGQPATFTPPAEHHTFHHHHLGVFTGYVEKDAKKKKGGFKTGLEYEYQFLEWLGVRGFVDYEAGDLKKWLYGGGAAFHLPDTGAVFFVGGGNERSGSKNEAFLRLSGEYQFHISEDILMAPTGGYDFPEKGKGAWFAGVMWGVSF